MWHGVEWHLGSALRLGTLADARHVDVVANGKLVAVADDLVRARRLVRAGVRREAGVELELSSAWPI